MMLHRHFSEPLKTPAKSYANYEELTKGCKKLGKKRKVAAYSGSRSLYYNMIPAIKSLLINSDVEKIYLLIQDDEFPYELPKEVETINVSNQKIFGEGSPNMGSPFTYMSMMRATYANLFPKLDRILSLDVDVIVDRDISDIWDLPIDDYYLSAVPELYLTTADRKYFNAGVVLQNLKKLRDGKADDIITHLNQFHYTFLEQDAFNERCFRQIHEMPPEYNSTQYTEKTENPRIIHYAGIADWTDRDLMKKYREIPWSEIR